MGERKGCYILEIRNYYILEIDGRAQPNICTTAKIWAPREYIKQPLPKTGCRIFQQRGLLSDVFSWNYLKIYLSILLSKGYKYIWAILGSTFWSKSKKEKLPHGWFSFTLSLSFWNFHFHFPLLLPLLKKEEIPYKNISHQPTTVFSLLHTVSLRQTKR